ncbi:tetratricopeptide repeat protein [Bacteroides sp. 214]|uniref:tetratricopeptide repeat protein n=1 Tax=Bacteroides sp. 214 TaxID=2302935 RepID=UPI0013D6F825|nr:tetratricopeptide repeat protein [Bacteroides sp. 214]
MAAKIFFFSCAEKKDRQPQSYRPAVQPSFSTDKKEMVQKDVKFSFILEVFNNLKNQKRYEEALSIYEDNEFHFLLYFKTSTAIYEFHLEIIDLYHKYYNESFALKREIELLEFDELIANMVIESAEDNHIPEHYGYLISSLFHSYMETKDWKKAQKQCENMRDFADSMGGKESSAYATALFNQAMLYSEVGNRKKAIEIMLETKQIYELAGMKHTNEWENCLSMLTEWFD